jgi:hypothetical protein
VSEPLRMAQEALGAARRDLEERGLLDEAGD